MAYMTSTGGAARTAPISRLSGLFTAFGARMEQYRTYRRTVNELTSLSDRELADLGINRSMIGSIATDAAYGAR